MYDSKILAETTKSAEDGMCKQNQPPRTSDNHNATTPNHHNGWRAESHPLWGVRDMAKPLFFGALLASAQLFVSAAEKGWVGSVTLDKPDPEECQLTSATGDSLYVEYTVLIDDRPQGASAKLEFKLGAAPVEGWDQHLAGMCIDEERELTIPPSTHGHKNIGMKDAVPKDAVLQFHIRLLDIRGLQRKRSYARWKERDHDRASARAKQSEAEL